MSEMLDKFFAEVNWSKFKVHCGRIRSRGEYQCPLQEWTGLKKGYAIRAEEMGLSETFILEIVDAADGFVFRISAGRLRDRMLAEIGKTRVLD